MNKIDAVIKLVEKELDNFSENNLKCHSVKRIIFYKMKDEVIGLIETLRETEVKEVNREIDNVFNQMINNYRVGSKNMYGDLFKKIVEFDEKHIERLNDLVKKLKYDIDLAVGDKLEGISK